MLPHAYHRHFIYANLIEKATQVLRKKSRVHPEDAPYLMHMCALSLSLSVHHPSISLSLWRVFKASALDLEQTYCLLMKQTEH